MHAHADGARPSLLVLWDIDHTLIKTGGVGRELSAIAFEAATGIPMRDMADPAGRTELTLFRETAAAHSIANPDERFPAFSKALAEAYEQHTDDLRERGRALPGAHKTLAGLAAEAHIAQGALSGNLRAVAEIKLKAFGLDTFIDLRISAFAEDSETRPGLVSVARNRAAQLHGNDFGGAATVLIGDTPNDVTAANTTDASVIAVASGRFTTEQLLAAGARNVVTDLTNPAVLATLLARAAITRP